MPLTIHALAVSVLLTSLATPQPDPAATFRSQPLPTATEPARPPGEIRRTAPNCTYRKVQIPGAKARWVLWITPDRLGRVHVPRNCPGLI